MHGRAAVSGFLGAGGEVGALMRAHDWSTSPLGDPALWPQSLRSVVGLLLGSKFPMFVAWGPELGFLYNDAYAEILGAKHPGALGARFHDIWTEIWPDISPLVDAALAGEASYRENLPLVMNRKGYDEETWFSFSYSPVQDESGGVAGMYCACTETTATVLAERRLRESEARFRNMADNAPVMMWVTDPDGYCIYLNRRWYEFTGQSTEQAEGYGWLDAIHADHKGHAGNVFAAANASREPFRVDYRLRRADGTYRWAIDAAAPRFAENGAFLGYVGSVIDIDERREAEEAHRESEARLRMLTNALPAFVWFATQDGELHYFNDRWYEYTGQTPDEALPNGWAATLHPDDAPDTARLWADARTRGGTYEAEVRYRRRDGAYRWYVARAEPLRNEGGAITGWFGTSTDINDRKVAEERLRELNDTLETRVAQAVAERDRIWKVGHDMFAVAGFDGYLKAVNAAWTRTLGFDEATLLSTPFADLIHPDDLDKAGEIVGGLMQGQRTEQFEDRLRTRDGSYRIISWTAVPEGEVFYAIGRDVTELRQTEEALRQSQKMEAVGQLTGGLAHDFNNLLAGIVGSLDLMQTRVRQGRTGDVERYVTAAMSSAQRAAALTHRLLAFSRRQPLDPKPVEPNGLVAGMEDLLRRTIGPSVQLEMVLAGGLWRTLCDPVQLESALLNLSINARDAMPEGGKLTIETSNAHLDDAYAAAASDVTPGQYVCISVTDSGTGMPSDVIARAFDPFFTTKPVGQGTGLGLSMVYGFTKQSEGHVRIYSELGEGTTVKIYLPRHRGGADKEDIAAPAAEAPRAEDGETVLVVEDEPVIRDLVIEVLTDLGYRALEAVDGPSGLKILNSRERIDLLVTDVGLPGLNGRQVADFARQKRPGLRVLFITGFAENATLANGFLEPGMQMITKPFAIDALTAKIRHMIEGT